MGELVCASERASGASTTSKSVTERESETERQTKSKAEAGVTFQLVERGWGIGRGLVVGDWGGGGLV